MTTPELQIINTQHSKIEQLQNELAIAKNRVEGYKSKYQYYKQIATNQQDLIKQQKEVIDNHQIQPKKCYTISADSHKITEFYA